MGSQQIRKVIVTGCLLWCMDLRISDFIAPHVNNNFIYETFRTQPTSGLF